MIRLFHVAMAPEAAEAVKNTLAAREDGTVYIGEGSQVAAFECALRELLVLPYEPLAMNSCTSALDLALHLIGVGHGDEVISTPMTCTATNCVIVNRGARIVWADIDPFTGLIDPDDVGRKITARTKAIMAVDWSGRLCDYQALRKYALPIVEDAAHAFLSTRDGQGLGSAGGDYICWSFQAIKHLTTGDGGALMPPQSQYERARLLRWYGLDRRSSDAFRCSQNIQEAGYKYHMNDIAAAIGLANSRRVREIVRQHRSNARWYHEALQGAAGVTLPSPDEGSAWWLYTLLVDDPNGFIAFLGGRGITASPVHSRNDTHRAFTFDAGPLPGVDAFAGREVAIPVGWWLTEDERVTVAEAVWAWAQAA